MDAVAVPAGKLLQIEVDLRLEGAEPGRAGLDAAADIGQKIGGVVQRKDDTLALKRGPQPIPIPSQILLTTRGGIIRPLRLSEGLRRKAVARSGKSERAEG
jgi:hypothetical protein